MIFGVSNPAEAPASPPSGTNPYTGTFPGIGKITSTTDQESIPFSQTQAGDVLQTDGAGGFFVGPLVDSSFEDVWSASTSNIGGLTYDNGASGVGATLTKATPYTSANLGLNGLPVQIGKIYLMKNQSIQFQNGPYQLTSANVLTRPTRADSGPELYPQQIRVLYGSNQNTLRSQTNSAAITMGTSNITYVTTPVPAFLTQEGTNTQAIYQIPRRTSVARQLSRGSNRFTFNLPALLFGVSADIDVTRTVSGMYRRILTSAGLFGTAYAGSGMRAGDTNNIGPTSTGSVSIATENGLYQNGSISPTTTALLTTSTSGVLDLTTANTSVGDFSGFNADIGNQSAQMISGYGIGGTNAYVTVSNGNTLDLSTRRFRASLNASVLGTARANQVMKLTDDISLLVDYDYPSQYNNEIVDLDADYTINAVYGNEDNGKVFTNATAAALNLPIRISLPSAPRNGHTFTFICVDPTGSNQVMQIFDPNVFNIYYDDATPPNTYFTTSKNGSSITITFDAIATSWYTTSARGTRIF